MLSKIALGSALFQLAQSAGIAEWKGRTVYQLLTDRFAKTSNDQNEGPCQDLTKYCGGTWKGIENNLDYIAGMGFDAIWISPHINNKGNDYHGYGGLNWEQANEHFGSQDDLISLVKTAHEKGMYVMADVVANHVAPVGEDYSSVVPFNKSEYFHQRCQINNWNDQNEVETCRLADLPDLDQKNPFVRQYLKNWVKKQIDIYGFDGIRIDTVPEVPKDFWEEYAQAAGVFQMGEVFNGNTNYVGDYQNHITGVFNYPMFFTIKDVFGSGKSMYNIRSLFNDEQTKFKDIDALGLFVDNHDNARFLNQQSDQRMFKNALLFSLTAKGIPFYYYGSEQAFSGGNDPQNRESLWQDMNTESDIYKFTQTVNAARKNNKIWESPMIEKYVLDNFYAYQRGNIFVALTNKHDNVSVQIPNSGFSNGTVVCNIFFPDTDCQTIQNGNINIFLLNGESKIYVPKESLYIKEDNILPTHEDIDLIF